MKILFLDFDGVLNCQRRNWNYLAPEMLARLDRIVGVTEAEIVITSSWREEYCHLPDRGRELLDGTLRRFGYTGRPVFSVTPHFNVGVHPDIATRGAEVRAWLDELANARPIGLRPECYVILDDAALFPRMEHRLVRTDPAVGLTDADAERVIALLTR